MTASARNRTRFIGPITVVIVGVVMMLRSWGTWPDVVVDFGRELYVPWQISEGRVLYRDIVSYFNGPLSPHVHALLFEVFGASLQTVVVFNLIVIALITTMLYALISHIAGRVAATCGACAFLTLFAFAQLRFTGNYNFVCPYSYELTHGIALTLAGITCLHRWARTDRRQWLIASGAMLGLVCLTKAEVFLAGATAMLSGVIAREWIQQRTWRDCAIDAISFIGATIAPVLLAWLLLMIHLTPTQAMYGIAGAWRWLGDRALLDLPYFKELAGTGDVAASGRTIATWSVAYLVLFGVPAVVGTVLRKCNRRAAVILFTLLLLLGLWFHAIIPWADFLRPAPFVVIIAALVSIRYLRHRDDVILPFVALVWSIMLLAKIWLNAHIYHYGFALAMPTMIVLVALLVGYLPRVIDQRGGDGGLLRAAALAALLVTVIAHVRVMNDFWMNKTVVVGTGGDAFWADWRGEVVEPMRVQLARGTPSDATVVVVPEGLILNHLARRENPTGQLNFTPPAMIMYGEDRMFEAFHSRPPDYIVLAAVDTAEYGARFFGTDYARELGGWLQANYVVVSRVGARPFQDEGFGMVLLKRR